MKKILTLLLLLNFCSCSEHKDEVAPGGFNPKKWAIKEGPDYPYRDEMLGDLMKGHNWKGMKEDSVLQLLGPPGRKDNNHLFYLVEQKRFGLLPIHTKSLVVKLDSTNRVLWMKIHK